MGKKSPVLVNTVLIFVFLGLTAAVSTGIVFMVRSTRTSMATTADYVYDEARDPRVGLPTIAPKDIKWLGEHKDPTRFFGVAVGPCLACSIKSLDHNLFRKLPNRPVIAIIQGKDKIDKTATAAYAGFDGYIQLSADQYRVLNAVWNQRGYWLSAKGELISSQPIHTYFEDYNRK